VRDAVVRGTVIGRQVALMHAVLEGDLPSLSDLAERAGLPLSTTHRLVANLSAQGLVRKTPWLTYLPGPRLLELVNAGVSKQPSSTPDPIRHKLAYGERESHATRGYRIASTG
jgi:DNA-binding IclR family transcriptional regulator